VSHATLIPTTILTLLSSFVAAMVLVLEYSDSRWVGLLLPLVLVSAIAVMWWVFPARVYTFRRKWLGIQGSVWLIIVFCAYDVLLGALTIGFTLVSDKIR